MCTKLGISYLRFVLSSLFPPPHFRHLSPVFRRLPLGSYRQAVESSLESQSPGRTRETRTKGISSEASTTRTYRKNMAIRFLTFKDSTPGYERATDV